MEKAAGSNLGSRYRTSSPSAQSVAISSRETAICAIPPGTDGESSRRERPLVVIVRYTGGCALPAVAHSQCAVSTFCAAATAVIDNGRVTATAARIASMSLADRHRVMASARRSGSDAAYNRAHHANARFIIGEKHGETSVGGHRDRHRLFERRLRRIVGLRSGRAPAW